VADIAETVKNSHTSGVFHNIVGAADSIGKDNILAFFGCTEDAVGFGDNLGMNHINIAITMGIMAIPAEFASLPGAVNNRIGSENWGFGRGIMF
jgi:hypothetical protein